jgi:hypothetical protein
MILKSLLLAEQIPYYTEFEHLMALRPFNHCINYNNTNLYILEEDYNDTLFILENYQKIRKLNNYSLQEKIISIIGILVIFYVIPSCRNHIGMDIHYRENK